MSQPRGPLRRVLAEPGTPYRRLAVAGLLGLAAAAATIGLLAGSGYVVGRAALQPGLSALVGILAAVEVLAFLRGPLRYAERLVGHDAALRALTRWRLWLYDCLSPRVPAALAGWRSGDPRGGGHRHRGRRPHSALGRRGARRPPPGRADRPRAAHLAPGRRRGGGRARWLPLGPSRRCAGRA